MSDPLPKSNPATLPGTPSATSLPGSAGGQLRLPLQAGQQTGKSGPDHAPASRFLLPADKKVKTMIATYGPSGSASSGSAALQKSLESRLQTRLPKGGLMMFIKGWKRKATPSGVLYCQLAASAHPIDGTDSGLWATSRAVERGHTIGNPDRANDRKSRIEDQVYSLHPTPRATDGDKATRTEAGAMAEFQRANGPCLATTVKALLPSPTSSTGGPEPEGKTGRKLATVATMYTTPSSRDWKDTPGMTAQRKDGKPRNDQLPRQLDGMPHTGTPAPTAKPGSAQLNPLFSLWLMGFSIDAGYSMQRAMQSFRK